MVGTFVLPLLGSVPEVWPTVRVLTPGAPGAQPGVELPKTERN